MCRWMVEKLSKGLKAVWDADAGLMTLNPGMLLLLCECFIYLFVPRVIDVILVSVCLRKQQGS